ncbi:MULTISPECIES: hypothetical protein [Maritimibacter]|nr:MULTISPECIES: hypothetical protein [Maritimibacter]
MSGKFSDDFKRNAIAQITERGCKITASYMLNFWSKVKASA